MSRSLLLRLATFLRLDPDEAWRSNAIAAMEVRLGYEHEVEFITFYRQCVVDPFTPWPELAEGLLRFTKKERRRQ